MAGLLVVVAFFAAIAIGLAVFGGPLVVAIIPIALFAIGFAGFQIVQRQQRATQMRSFREEASAEKTDFSARDRQTTVQDSSDG